MITDEIYNDLALAALSLFVSAMLVLAYRGLPQIVPSYPGLPTLRAGLLGTALIVPAWMLFTISLNPKFNALRSKYWACNPQANVIAHLIDLLTLLEELGDLEKRREDAILELAVVLPKEGSSSPPVDDQQRDRLTSFALFRPAWSYKRERVFFHIVETANYVERGLPVLFGLGGAAVDKWTKTELQGRAWTMRSWAQRIALPSPNIRGQLLGEVAATIELAATGDWAALPKSKLPEGPGPLQKLMKFLRMALIGALPLSVIAITPWFDFEIPAAVRDAVFQFSIPWLVLLLLGLAAPDASQHLSRSKGIREILPF